MGVAVADYDNDRWPDIFITAVGGNRLYRNRDGKLFEDVTAAAGVGGAISTWPNVSADAFLAINEPISFPPPRRGSTTTATAASISSCAIT